MKAKDSAGGLNVRPENNMNNDFVDNSTDVQPVTEETTSDEFVIPDEKVDSINIDPVVKAPEKLSDLTNYDNSPNTVKNDTEEKQKRAENFDNPFEGMPQVQDLNLNDNSNSNDADESNLNPLEPAF